jgi:hypothetical protein
MLLACLVPKWNPFLSRERGRPAAQFLQSRPPALALPEIILAPLLMCSAGSFEAKDHCRESVLGPTAELKYYLQFRRSSLPAFSRDNWSPALTVLRSLCSSLPGVRRA